MLHQFMDPKGEYLENHRYADGCQKFNTSTKAVYVTQLSDALIIQLNTKYTTTFSNMVVVTVRRLFPTKVSTKKFHFG